MSLLESKESLANKLAENQLLKLQIEDIDPEDKILKRHQTIVNDSIVPAYDNLYIRKSIKKQIKAVISDCFLDGKEPSKPTNAFLEYCYFSYCYFSWERINVEVNHKWSNRNREEIVKLKSDIKTLKRFHKIKHPPKVESVSFITNLAEPFNLKSEISLSILQFCLTEKHLIGLEGFLSSAFAKDLYLNRAITKSVFDGENMEKISSFKNPWTQACHDNCKALNALITPLIIAEGKKSGKRKKIDFIIGYILFLTGFCSSESALLSNDKRRKANTLEFQDFDFLKLSKWAENNRK